MDPKKFAQKNSKVAGTTKIDLIETQTQYRDSDYKLVPCSDTIATETGFVIIATLKAQRDKRLPEFYLRWDDKKDELDVDIYVDGVNCKDLWRQPGYNGHKTIPFNPDEREFKVCIKTPERRVFEGVIRVRLLFSVGIQLHCRNQTRASLSLS
jgi:hypothetical protein